LHPAGLFKPHFVAPPATRPASPPRSRCAVHPWHRMVNEIYECAPSLGTNRARATIAATAARRRARRRTRRAICDRKPRCERASCRASGQSPPGDVAAYEPKRPHRLAGDKPRSLAPAVRAIGDAVTATASIQAIIDHPVCHYVPIRPISRRWRRDL